MQYRVKGHRVDNLLGQRLNDIEVKNHKDLPGIFTYLADQAYYSELYFEGDSHPIHKRDFDKKQEKLLERVTKECILLKRREFSVGERID